MLAQTLQTLEVDGFVSRKVFPEIPPRVEYTLTSTGQELAAHINPLVAWIESNVGRVFAARAKLDSKQVVRRRDRCFYLGRRA